MSNGADEGFGIGIVSVHKSAPGVRPGTQAATGVMVIVSTGLVEAVATMVSVEAGTAMVASSSSCVAATANRAALLALSLTHQAWVT